MQINRQYPNISLLLEQRISVLIAIICIVVLLFPIKETLKFFFPFFSITYCLKVEMTNSRETIIKAGIATDKDHPLRKLTTPLLEKPTICLQ